MSDNNHNFDDELLSAYVDGELTGEQLSLVERQLENSASARQLVDELRALSQEIQSLPKQELADDLRLTVMQRAERAMLIGTEQPATLTPRQTSSSRRWAWAAMAIAATLFMAVYLPTEKQDEKQLATAKPAPDSAPGNESREISRLEAAEEPEPSEAMAASATAVPSAAANDSPRRGAGEPKAETATLSAGPPMAEELADVDTGNKQLQLTCVVNITLNDSAKGAKQFDQLLLSNGIALRAQTEGDEASTAVAQGRFATKALDVKDKPDSSGGADSAEFVLVEAPMDQIEGVLEESNLDTSNYAEVRLTEQQVLPDQPLDRLRQWERSARQPAQNRVKKFNQRARSALAAQQGWATRIDAGRYQQNLRQQQSQPLGKADSRTRKVATQDPVQVLFILRKGPTAESAGSIQPANPN